MSTPRSSSGSVEVSGVVSACVRGLEKTPTAIRDVLDPAQRERFESEYRAALVSAADTLDLEPVLTLVQRTWWVRAVMCLNPEMLDGVASDLNRIATGDESLFVDEGHVTSQARKG